MAELYLGLMSGTSVDALDIALCRFEPRFEIIERAEAPFPETLRTRINRFTEHTPLYIDDLLLLERDYTQFCAQEVNRFLTATGFQPDQISAIGFHGQTLRHIPTELCTLQAGNPSLLAELCGIDVIADFRRRDLAAGGEGAPLVPAFHQYLTLGLERPFALLNLGGIANLTLFDDNSPVRGFDSGPANILMDYWIKKHQDVYFDAQGRWADTGKTNEALLNRMLGEEYFSREAPKSTGRELFNAKWLASHLADYEQEKPENVQRTLLELTARSAAQALIREARDIPRTLILCGGGAENTLLSERLKALLPDTRVINSDQLGWPASHIEAAAFAWLAFAFNNRQTGNLPSVTGASGGRILGALYPR